MTQPIEHAQSGRNDNQAARGRRVAAVLMAIVFLAAAVVGCRTTPPPSVTSVTVDQADFGLQVGASSAPLTATVVVTGGASQDVVWSSGAPAVATVDEDSGVVTAVAVGTAVITATSVDDATQSDSVTVTVSVTEVPSVTSVTVDQADFGLQVGASSAPLTATVVVTGGASQDVVWSSGAPAVATVDEDSGVVTAVAVGTAVITATSVDDATQSDSVTVTVTETIVPVTSIADLDAALALGSRVDLAWNAENATDIDVVCFDGTDEQPIESLGGTATGTTIAIPASDCLEVRVYARGAGNDDEASLVLDENVVVNGDDAGTGSLRATVDGALPGSIIGFAADVATVTLSTVQVFPPNDAHMFLNEDVTISGPTAAPVTIRSDDTLPNDVSGAAVNRSRIFFVPVGVTVQLDGLVVTGGTFIGAGAGVRNDGDLTITNSVFEGNRAWYRGGAITNRGTLRVEDSVLRDNLAQVTDGERTAGYLCIRDAARTCDVGDVNYIVAPGQGGSGGALYNELGTAVLVRTAMSGNQAMYSGGGVFVDAGSVTVTDSDILDNAADATPVGFPTQSYGGGVQNLATFSMTGGSVEGNASEQDGGGVSNGSFGFGGATMTLTDVFVTLNAAGIYGGGAVNFHEGVVTNLSELGTTSISGNTAGNTGNNRYDIDISLLTASSIMRLTALETPQIPAGHLDR